MIKKLKPNTRWLVADSDGEFIEIVIHEVSPSGRYIKYSVDKSLTSILIWDCATKYWMETDDPDYELIEELGEVPAITPTIQPVTTPPSYINCTAPIQNYRDMVE